MYGMKGNIFEIFLNTVSLSILLAKASFAFLLISMFSYWFQAAFKYTKNRVLSKLPLVAMYSANLTLAFMLSLRWIESGHFPLSNLYESLLFLSWSLTSIHLFLESVVNKGEQVAPSLTLGAITSPLCLFTNAFATFSLPQEMQKITVLVPALQSNWLIMHVSVMIISYAALLSGSLLAMAFLVSRFVEDAKISDNLPFNIVSFRNTTYSVRINPYFSHVRNTFTSLLHRLLPVVQSKTGSVPVSQTISASIPKVARPLAAPQAISASHTTPLPKAPKVVCGKVMEDGNLSTLYNEGNNTFGGNNGTGGMGSHALQFEGAYGGSKNKEVKELLGEKRGIMKTQSTVLANLDNCLTSTPSKLKTFSKNANFLTPYCEIPPRNHHNASTSSSNLVDEPVNKMMKHTFKRNLSQTLDNLSYRSIGLGFALLTIGILSGAVWANEAWGSYWSWDPKETWAFVTWLVFAFYLHTRLSKGWVGKESAFVAIFGFAIIWFCYLGVNFFGKGLHSYGWFQTIR